MDGKEYVCSKFVQSLRIRLFKEHLGFKELSNRKENEFLIDPLNDDLFEEMKSLARSNASIYSYIFNVYPDNKFITINDLIEYKRNNKENLEFLKEKYDESKDKIIGNIVEFPLEFLKEENINRRSFCKEVLVPIKNFL